LVWSVINWVSLLNAALHNKHCAAPFQAKSCALHHFVAQGARLTAAADLKQERAWTCRLTNKAAAAAAAC
jgi:hypothetical protein